MATFPLDVRSFLAQHGWPEYDLQAVWDYMTAQCWRYGSSGNANGGDSWDWFWVPLRAADCGRGRVSSYALAKSDYIGPGHAYAQYGVILEEQSQPYKLPIPLPVVYRIGDLVEQFPYAVFYVTRIIPQSAGCSFLAITSLAAPLIVVAQWGEPSYGRVMETEGNRE